MLSIFSETRLVSCPGRSSYLFSIRSLSSSLPSRPATNVCRCLTRPLSNLSRGTCTPRRSLCVQQRCRPLCQTTSQPLVLNGRLTSALERSFVAPLPFSLCISRQFHIRNYLMLYKPNMHTSLCGSGFQPAPTPCVGAYKLPHFCQLRSLSSLHHHAVR